MGNSRWMAVLITLIVLGGLGLRVTGLGKLLPHAPEPDAYFVDQAGMMRDGEDAAPLRRHIWGKYPHLLARTLELLTEPQAAKDAIDGANLKGHLENAAAPMISGRLLSALLSIIAIPLTYLLALRFLGKRGAILAAALLATSLLHLCASQQARPHAPFTTAVVATLLASFAILRGGATPRNMLLGSLSLALGIGMLQSGFALALPLAVAFLLRGGERTGRDWIWLLAPVALVAATVAGLYPFLYDGTSTAGEVRADGVLVQPVHAFDLDFFDGTGFVVLWRTLASYDPVLLALGIAGLILLLKQAFQGTERSRESRHRELLLCATFVVPYLLVFGLYGRSFDRFFLPLLPFLAILSAYAVKQIAGPSRPRLGPALALLALVFPTWVALSYARLNLAEDSITRAVSWLEQNADPSQDAILLDPFLTLPVPFAGQEYKGIYHVPWRDYLLENSLAMGEQGVWNVTQLSPQSRKVNPQAGDWLLLKIAPTADRAQHIQAVGDLATVIAGYEGDIVAPGERFEDYSSESMVSRVLGAKSWGPAIAIYKLRPDR